MKKKLLIIGLIFSALLVMTSCGQKVSKCDKCDGYEFGEKRSVYGNEVFMCYDCIENHTCDVCYEVDFGGSRYYTGRGAGNSSADRICDLCD